MGGLTRIQLSRYSRTDCTGKMDQVRSQDASSHSAEEDIHTSYGIGDFITFYTKNGHSTVPCSGSNLLRCILISFFFIRPGFPSFPFNSVCV